jgi:molecular chaperone GrpE
MAKKSKQHVEPSATQPTPEVSEEVFEIEDFAEAEVVGELQAAVEEARQAKLRVQADFANFQRRSIENENRARGAGTSGAVRALLPALDQFDLAMSQDPEHLTVEQLLVAIEMVHAELVKGFESQGVIVLRPEPGTEFDPAIHAAVMKESTLDWPENSVVKIVQVGYKLGEIVLRPASVVVSVLPEND